LTANRFCSPQGAVCNKTVELAPIIIFKLFRSGEKNLRMILIFYFLQFQGYGHRYVTEECPGNDIKNFITE
jgi:hypothetical protein